MSVAGNIERQAAGASGSASRTGPLHGSMSTAGPVEASDVSSEDLRISATARGARHLDAILKSVARRVAPKPPKSLLDLGCGMGGLTRHVGRALGVDELFGADYDPVHAEAARRNGVQALVLDLNAESVPLPDDRVGMVTSFGVLAYLPLYDNALSEAARVLEPGGWFLFSMPNLGSYGNRLRLLLGRQPDAVDVSAVLHPHRTQAPMLHSATLRYMRELLGCYGFSVTAEWGFSPDSGRHRLGFLDPVVRPFPSLCRRFVILARNDGSASCGR
jgi:SAM-dependent methyltransferase